MKTFFAAMLAALICAGCASNNHEKADTAYIQVQDLPEMTVAWNAFNKYPHATALLIPSWCKISDMRNPDRGYFFPLYFLQHNSEQTRSFYDKKVATFEYKADLKSEIRKVVTAKKGKIIEVTDIPVCKLKLSDTSFIYHYGATAKFTDVDKQTKKYSVIYGMAIVYSNGLFTNAMSATTIHNDTEMLKYQQELCNFANYLQKNNIYLPKCAGDGTPGRE